MALDILNDILHQKALAASGSFLGMEDAILLPFNDGSDAEDDHGISWFYDARILFNPLLQIWHHCSLAPRTAPPTDATLTPEQVREKLQSMIRHLIE
jgi:hypothetical protein